MADDGESGEERRARIEALAAEIGPLAYSVALRMLGDRASAEDVVQDAFVQAFRGLARFRGEASIRTWFLRILVNRCRRHRRGLLRRTGTNPVEAGLVDAAGPQVAEGDPALRARLEAAVARLPHRQRTAFVLRYGQDLRIDEIAEVMGCAQGTVKATLHKAVHRLRKELGDLPRGEHHGT